MKKSASKYVPQNLFMQVIEQNDIPHDVYMMLMEQCAIGNYMVMRRQMKPDKDVLVEQIRMVSMDETFELARIQTIIHSIKKANSYYEQYTIRCNIAGMSLCKNVFLTQSPTQFAMWQPTAPNLQTLYREFKKKPQIDVSNTSAAATAILQYYLQTKSI